MKRLTFAMAVGSLFAILGPVDAAVVTRTVDYSHDGTTFEGYLAYDDAIPGKRPGVLVIHQWMGVTDNERMRAEMLAEMGYVAFAVDVYGKGVRPKNRDEAAQERLDILAETDGAFRCRTAFNCTEACPREIHVTQAVAEVKKAIMTGKLD